MYLSHYDLTEKPFQLSPDPRFLWLGDTHKEALATLRYGILENRGLLLLVGDVGTGKTTLINGLLNSLNDDITVATIFDPGLEKIEFFNFLANTFKLGRRYESKGDFLVHFIHFLNREHAHGRKTLLIIDEAQRLSIEMLEEIRLLSNIEKQDVKLLNIFLVGQNELLDTLAAKRSRAFLHRITTNYNIRPLKKTEVEDYIRFRMKVAGTEKRIFNKAAIRSIIAFSDCYPRLINTICDHALLTGYVNNLSRINARTVNSCRKELQIRARPRIRNSTRLGMQTWKVGLFTGIPCLLIALAGGYYYIQKGEQAPPARSIAPLTEREGPPPSQAVIEPPQQVDPEPDSAPRPQPKPLPPKQLPPVAGSAPAEEHSLSSTVSKETRAQAATPQPSQTTQPLPLPVPDKATTINVPFDSVTLSMQTYTVISHLADIALQNADVTIHIKGHTDTSGSKRYNASLSKFRAEFFKSYFIGRGIDPARIKTFGMGSRKPVASNATSEGRQANRRVEIEFKK